MAAPVLIKRTAAVAVLLTLVVSLFHENHAWANEIPVCSMSRDEFVEAAFPDNALTEMYSGRLIKHARPPGLVVLAPAERSAISKQIETAFAKIAKDDVVPPLHSSFLTYGTFSEATKAVEQFGYNNIFVLIAEEPADAFELQQFRLVLERIVRSPRDVDALVDQSKRIDGVTSRGRIDLATAEVISTAIVINSRNDDVKIPLLVYVSYYANIAISAASSTELFFRRFFELTPPQRR